MIPIAVLFMLAAPVVLQFWTQPSRPTSEDRPIDIGVMFAWIVAIYGSFPLIGIGLAQLGVGSIQEQRMGDTLPEAKAVHQVGAMYVVFLIGFVIAYGLTCQRGKAFVRPHARQRAPVDLVFTALLLFAFVQLGIAAIRFGYGIGQGLDYLDSYAGVQDQSLFVRQVLGLFVAADLAAAVLLIVSVMAWKPRWHVLVLFFVIAQIALTFVLGGSRSYAFLCGFAYVVSRSIYGPRLRMPTLAIMGLAGLLSFMAAGAVRQFSVDAEEVSALSFLQGGEFIALFYNSLDLLEKGQDIRSPALTLGLYLVDLLRLLPRQIIGDIKIDPAVMYVSTFYPVFYEAGGGLAFGAIAESTLGLGVPEALIRGSLLGTAYAVIRNYSFADRWSTVHAFIYTWFVVMAYQGLRDTTFSLFPRFVLQVLPLLLLVHFADHFWAKSRNSRTPRSKARDQRDPTPTGIESA